ncbi:MAG: protein-glutamate O-methyltransferase CheR [Myxococcales bacterium]|nr:MAG: protein-glutamate O-methyltransferase CheR [Myxococcales bacterium]
MMTPNEETELRSLLESIYQRFHYDFRQYSQASVRRRVAQAQQQLGCATLSALQELILHDEKTFPALLQYLTVQVSDLFRDPAYWRVFRERVVPVLRTYPSIKLWVAGCSAGEEVYSFAILLREEGLLDKTILYATDINTAALEAAQAGIYPLERMKTFTVNHQASGAPCSLSEYYTAGYGSAVFDRTLRRNVVFSDHSLATDAVFAEVQVVSCRNVLIYFERDLQDRAFRLFGDALCVRGFLGLGSKETLRFSTSEHDFDTFAAEERWYQRR